MRNTTILLLLNVFHICAFDSYSQETALTVNLENFTVRDILAQIEEQSEFYFLYNSKLIDANRKTSLKVEDQDIDQILTMLFKDTGVNYLVYNRQIVLSPGEFSDALSPLSPVSEKIMKNAQQLVTGKVTDSQTGETLPGVSVTIKDTNIGTVTNADGIFSLSNVPDDAVLIFSYVGMQTQEIPVEGRTEINVELNTDVIGIEEVVAIGYGTMRRSDLTGSVVRADIESFEESPNISIMQSLQGSIPGLSVGQVNQAGQEPNILIRGQSS
ncbi:MAG: carboxypeptidase-like regulatory domain-containing protein, partial [Bacteroidales bacterium]